MSFQLSEQATKRVKIIGIIASVLVVIASLFSLIQSDLYRYQSLFFYGGIWFLIWFLGLNTQNAKRRLLILASSLLLASSFPPYPFILAFIGFVPILLLIETAYSRSHRSILWEIYLALLGFNIFATYWVANTAFVPMGFTYVFNAFLMLLPMMLYLKVKKHIGGHLQIWLFVSCWLTFEFLHHHWGLSWTWLTLGNALSSQPWLIQWFSFTGVFGGSLWILLVNYLIFGYYTQKNKKLLIELAVVVVIPVLVSLILYLQPIHQESQIKVALANPNVEPNIENRQLTPEDKLVILMKLLAEHNLSEVDLLLIPESYFEFINLGLLSSHPIIQTLQEVSKNTHTDIICGVQGHEFYIGDKPNRPNVRSTNENPVRHYEVFNNALGLHPEDQIQIYNKVKFVPGAESFPLPFKEHLSFLEPFVRQAHGTIYGLATYPRDELFTIDHDRYLVAPLICYEGNYGEFVASFVKKGANAITIVTEDGWWNNTKGHKQFRYINGLRAIECGRAVARAANYGQCMISDAKGKALIKPNAYGQKALIIADLPIYNKSTFYVQWTDYIGRISVGLLFFILLIAVYARIAEYISKKPTS